MESDDIKKLQKILRYKERGDLSELLSDCITDLDISGTYGSRWNSVRSTFYIKFPPSKQKKFDELKEEDRKVIFDSLLRIYPIKDNEPEVIELIYEINFDIEENSLIETIELERISFDYIQEQILKCRKKIEEGDYAGAVTNARTLIETVCLFIIETKTKVDYDNRHKGDLKKIHTEVASLLKMSPGDYEDPNLKQILSGVFTIINGVSGLRNNYSDSHGVSPSKSSYKIDKRHAILTVNLAKTISEYLYLSFEKSEDIAN